VFWLPRAGSRRADERACGAGACGARVPRQPRDRSGRAHTSSQAPLGCGTPHRDCADVSLVLLHVVAFRRRLPHWIPVQREPLALRATDIRRATVVAVLLEGDGGRAPAVDART